MKQLYKIRLTSYFLVILATYLLAAIFVDKVELSGAALTLFSANSFLYGFYISPIVASQRTRMDNLNKTIEFEAAKLFEISQYTKRMEEGFRNSVTEAISHYARHIDAQTYKQAEKDYQALVEVLLGYDGDKKDEFKEAMKAIFVIQQNRNEIHRLLTQNIFRNEWIIMCILFVVTMLFIMIIEIPGPPALRILPPIICTGLTMLIVVLAKMNSLTHKRVRNMWEPIQALPKRYMHTAPKKNN